MADSTRGRGGGGNFRGRGGGSGGDFPGSSGGFRGGRGGGADRGRGGFVPRGGGNFGADIPMPKGEEHRQLVAQPMAPGTVGTPIELLANFYRFKFDDIPIFHYDVIISKDTPKEQERPSSAGSGDGELTNVEKFIKKFASVIMDQFSAEKEDLFSGVKPVFDGFKNLFTCKPLAISGGKRFIISKVTVSIDNRPSDFNIKLTLVDRVAMSEAMDFYLGKQSELPERVIHVFEIVFRSLMNQVYECYQRKFFDLTMVQRSPKVSNMVDFVSGFIPSVRMCEFGLALNLHLKTSCIVAQSQQKLLDFVGAVANIQPGKKPSRVQIVEANKMIRHLRMYTQHSAKKILYTMDGLVDRGPRDFTFSNREGQRMNISEYFKTEYAIQLQDLPLVKTVGKQPKYIPLELCYLVENQFLSNSKINSTIQRELLMKSTHAPNVYFDKLGTIVKKIASTDKQLQEQYGLELTTKPVAFEGRVLPTPKLLNADPRAQFFTCKQTPKNWAVFCFDPTVTPEELKQFITSMLERARFFGLNFSSKPHPIAKVDAQNAKDIYSAFYNLHSKTEAEFVFVAIPNRHPQLSSSMLYSLVKYNCDQEFGIVSQCFKAEFISRIPNGYFDNFLQKVNGKLGGLNSALDPAMLRTLPFNLSRTMLVGIDVNHPGETERVASSVAAAVGSTDALFSQYSASIRVQMKDRDEIVKDLHKMMAELLIEFHKINSRYPENIVVFRDGVSEGQFDKVKKTEIALIQAAINKITSGQSIKITMIIIQKRHHTRFVRQTPNTAGRKPTFNVPSGTVVDHTIVEPMHKMFYLNSHFSPLGTSRPTKYVILKDDLKLSTDDIEKMCFIMCHNCIRTRNVIALPTPVRYAHLCAYRSKMHIEAQREVLANAKAAGEDSDEDELGSGVNFEESVIKRLNKWVKVHNDIKNKLYYC